MTSNYLKNKLYVIIFESDTPAGKGFDLLLIASIIISVIVVLLDSVKSYNNLYGDTFYIMEWVFTLLFTFEYVFMKFVFLIKMLSLKSLLNSITSLTPRHL